MLNPPIERFEKEYEFLSNFFWHDDWTVEHYFQAAKTDDPLWAARILLAPTPTKAKERGRSAPKRPTWEKERDVVMLTLLRLKFHRGSSLVERLLATGDAILVEGNWWGDTYWGVCKGVGLNRLGTLLMQVRSELKAAKP